MVRVLCPPPGRLETSVTGRAVPGSSRFTEVSSAKYMVSPRNARPKGPSRPLRTVVPESATPSPFESTRRSEEHTSELQSPYDLVCRLLLEKKKEKKNKK